MFCFYFKHQYFFSSLYFTTYCSLSANCELNVLNYLPTMNLYNSDAVLVLAASLVYVISLKDTDLCCTVTKKDWKWMFNLFLLTVNNVFFLLRCVLCARTLRLGCRWWSSGSIQQPPNSSAQQGKEHTSLFPSSSSVSQTLMSHCSAVLPLTAGIQTEFNFCFIDL